MSNLNAGTCTTLMLLVNTNKHELETAMLPSDAQHATTETTAYECTSDETWSSSSDDEDSRLCIVDMLWFSLAASQSDEQSFDSAVVFSVSVSSLTTAEPSTKPPALTFSFSTGTFGPSPVTSISAAGRASSRDAVSSVTDDIRLSSSSSSPAAGPEYSPAVVDFNSKNSSHSASACWYSAESLCNTTMFTHFQCTSCQIQTAKPIKLSISSINPQWCKTAAVDWPSQRLSPIQFTPPDVMKLDSYVVLGMWTGDYPANPIMVHSHHQHHIFNRWIPERRTLLALCQAPNACALTSCWQNTWKAAVYKVSQVTNILRSLYGSTGVRKHRQFSEELEEFVAAHLYWLPALAHSQSNTPTTS